MKNQYEEIKGDNQNESLEQLEMCKYLVQGEDKPCRHRDIYGRCTFENCVLDSEESPLRSKKWWFQCIICKHPTSIEPDGLRVPFCESCISRMNEAEVLPFTCRYCGKKQYTPSKWMFSRVCDECIPLLYNKNAGQTCLKYTPKAGKHSISKGGSMHDYK